MATMQEIEKLLTDYRTWLKDNTTLREVNASWIEITTPYLDRHNDALQIYARAENGGYVLTDDCCPAPSGYGRHPRTLRSYIYRPCRQRTVELLDRFFRHAAILHRMSEVESRLDSRQQQMRAGGLVSGQLSAVKRGGCRDLIRPRRGKAHGYGARVAVTDNAGRTFAEIDVSRGISFDCFRR
jgi:hypothetical protein